MPPSSSSHPDSSQYTLLPTGPSDSDNDNLYSPTRFSTYADRLSYRFRPSFHKRLFRPLNLVLFSLVALLLVTGAFVVINRKNSAVDWPPDVFEFEEHKPAYLDAPVSKPLIIRLAIVSRANEFEKREALRQAMLRGIPSTHVQMDYRFFIARPTGYTSWITKMKVRKEMDKYKDIEVLHSIRDIPERISEKRFAALKWTGSSAREYDYSMTMDSDSFCRFRALSQRLRHVYADIKPRTEAVLLGSMASQHVYYTNTVPDGNSDDNEEDSHFIGPWYSYPAGIGYLMSYNLTATMLSLDPPLPHHVHYPSDDVMIGAWAAGLRYLPDPTQQFESPRNNSDDPIHPVYPKPYLPYIVNTVTVDDKVGWHDFKNRGGAQRPIGWESVCIHRVKPNEMRA
ncbi:hypothetical protein D9613_009796 [Agrocybe pediades]|uniref:Hexosyltransferase n=1 Tax=Agrocybe pediades TaxID=84607 RepID=A0A8H4VQT5_9AGAR|nr:hypothetical protein D9613_009796 [Agrocybe pediades]